MHALQNIVVSTKALTQNSFTKILDANGGRKFLDIPNPAAATVGLYYGSNPWCAAFTTETCAADAILANTQLLASTKGSIRARIKCAALSAVATIFSISNEAVGADETSLVFYMDADNKLCAKLTIAGVEQWALITDSALDLSTWFDVKLVHNGIHAVLYVNGEMVAQTLTGTSAATKAKWIASIAALANAARIGSLDLEETETLTFIGSLNNVVVVDGLAIKELGASTDVLASNLPTVIANWKFEDGTGTNVDDISGNGYDATLSAATVWAAKGDTDALGAGQWFDAAVPVMAIWGYTTESGKSLTVKEGW